VLADVIALAREPAAGGTGPALPAGQLAMAGGDEDTAALIVVEPPSREEDVHAVRGLLEDRGVAVAYVARDDDDPATLRAGLVTTPAPRPVIASAVATLDADPRFAGPDGVRWMPALG
jgi:hypothetical protein